MDLKERLIEESDYAELGRLSRKLKIPVPTMRLKMVVEKDGEILDTRNEWSRTAVRNYYNFLFTTVAYGYATGSTYGAGYLSCKRYNDGYVTNPSGAWDGMIGALGNVSEGIVIGTGSTAESFEHHQLTALIATGNGSGQMAYSAQDSTTYSYNAGTTTWTATLTRVFNNNSGGSIVVAETGIHNGVHDYQVWLFLMCRDLPSPAVTVVNGAQLTVSYEIILVFPA
jgi:hypothetical protein